MYTDINTGVTDIIKLSTANEVIFTCGLGHIFRKTGCFLTIACVLAAPVAVKDSSFEPAVLLTQLLYGVYAELFLHKIIACFLFTERSIFLITDSRLITVPSL